MIKIAVCDDDMNIVKEIVKFLHEYESNNSVCFEISEFYDGDELLTFNKKFDLIFLDIKMVRVNGFEVADKIRGSYMNVPIIYITSHSGFFERAFKVHAFEYIIKPIEQERLLRVMNDNVAFIDEFIQMSKYEYDFNGILYNKILSPGAKLFARWFQ